MLRRADQTGAPCPAADPLQGGPRWPRAKRSGSPCLCPPRAGSSPGRAAARPTGPGAEDPRCEDLTVSCAGRIRTAHRPRLRILTRRPTLAQGEAQRQPLPLPSPRWILSRTRGSEATGPTRCGSSRRRSSRQLRRADQSGSSCALFFRAHSGHRKKQNDT